MQAPNVTALVADRLEIERGGRMILAGVSFTAKAGRALVLKGPNGAGKTSLIRACAGLLPPRAGRINLEGGDPDLEIGAYTHYVGHLNALKPALTVRENLAFWANFLGAGSEHGERVEAALERFTLQPLAEIPTGYLSAGQKRRTALARLLVAPRPVWLLDEPTVALDTRVQELFTSIVDDHLRAGGIVVAATHQPLPFSDSEDFQVGLRAASPAEDFA